MHGYIQSCRVCHQSDLVPFFDLGHFPLANSLLNSPAQKEESYPLALVWCPTCSLVQLNFTVDPEILFSHYFWVTGTSEVTRNFAEIFFKETIARTVNPKNDYILEIASNDGTFLQPFKRNGYKVLGVDPAKNIVEMAKQNGIPTEALFWGSESATQLKKQKGPARVVFARNVLPHVASTSDFVKGLSECLAEDGTLAVEFHYAYKILDGLQYDSIYHEHLCYFTLKPMEHLLKQFGLHVFDVLESPISGGAMIVYASKKILPESEKLKQYRDLENKKELNQLKTWQNFAKQCHEHGKKLFELVSTAKKEGKKIIGWGASARSSTLINFCKIDSKLVESIIDMNPLKHGKFTSGSHILIESPEKGMDRKPDMIFLTGWNFADEIIKISKTKFNFTGDCLVPLPNQPKMILKK